MNHDPLWQPDPQRAAATRMADFARQIRQRFDLDGEDYGQLWQWSVSHRAEFWSALWDYAGVIGEKGHDILTDDIMPGAKWFPQARLNFARNLLRRRDAGEALVFWGEDRVKRRLSHAELYAQVAQLAAALKAQGVQPGDRVAAYLPNLPETLIAMLASASLGAIFSSCSPDFGVQGVLDRFGQIEPKVLIAADGYFYAGKTLDGVARVGEIAQQLPSLTRVVVVPYVHEPSSTDLSLVPNGVSWAGFLAQVQGVTEIDFVELPFSHPLYIMYSSGTTGVPKCIVHGAGGTLLQHLKEHLLHGDTGAGDRLFYFTTCGWMMWNWLMSGLAAGASLLLYDGSPFACDGRILFDLAEREGMTHFGTSAKFIDALAKTGFEPIQHYRLASLRALFSTGSPLAPESFDFVYQKIKADLCLSSISGGTDIISCFALGNPILPVYRGELQCRGLGMAVEVWDDDGQPLKEEKGELVCVKPFPSMPIGFWNDPDGAKYRAAYFEKFPGVWCHGDYVELTEHGGLVIYGRSDAVLNPGGVRIGTAEIYRQVERLSEVVESLVIGQDWPPGDLTDVRVVLFVRLREGLVLDEALQARIRQTIRANTTPRHVPAKIVQVQDIPRTKSGKIVELAVRHVVHGRAVKNQEALANPEALAQYRDRPELLS